MKKTTALLAIAFMLCWLATACSVASDLTCELVNWEIERRNRKLRDEGGLALQLEEGYDWVAGPTDISRLSERDLRMLCGEDTRRTRDSTSSANPVGPGVIALAVTDSPLPVRFDWRSFKGADWTTPIRRQGHCKSCVAHAAVAVMESLLKIDSDDPDTNPDLSEQFVFLLGGGKSCDKGWNVYSAAAFLEKVGVPDEDCWRYDTKDTSKDNRCSDWKERVYKAASSRELTSAEEMKRSLVENGPLLGRFDVYWDLRCYASGTYRHVLGKEVGGHAVAIVGYDDANRCWIVKNSWGFKWGEDGWFTIGYGESAIDEFAIEIKLPTPSDESTDST